MSLDLLVSHFPHLTAEQQACFARLPELYGHWNAQINVISRKDIDQLLERHVLHSLAIAKVQPFKPGTEVMDLGTGGGFPGIPLAIAFPDVQFVLVDSIGKKIRVVEEVAAALGLANVNIINGRAEKVEGEFDFVVSRAVAPLADLVNWTRGKFNQNCFHDLSNGILCLKGGDLAEEFSAVKRKPRTWDISQWYEGEFFETKKVVWYPMVG